jgi:hypothetical protein
VARGSGQAAAEIFEPAIKWLRKKLAKAAVITTYSAARSGEVRVAH